jgi:hypothetical protein
MMAEVLPLTLKLKLLVTHLGDGRTTEVVVAVGEQTSSIAAVKERISELDGIEAANQYLFRVDEYDVGDCSDGGGGGSDDLSDDEVLCASCELYLFVGDTRFKWDSGCASPVGIFAFVNATTVRRDEWPLEYVMDIDYDFMRTLPSMRGNECCRDGDIYGKNMCSGGIFTISLKFTRSDDAIAAAAWAAIADADAADDAAAYDDIHDNGHLPGPQNLPRPHVNFGLVATDLTEETGLMMGSSWRVVDAPRRTAADADGNGNANQSVIHLGSVITAKWDANKCRLQVFMDGKLHATNVQRGARGIPLQWAVAAACSGTVIEIVECEDDLVTIKD